MPTKLTPFTAAKSLRLIFESMIAKDWDDYPGELSAYQFALLVKEQTACTFREAARATSKVCPELMANYWEERRVR